MEHGSDLHAEIAERFLKAPSPPRHRQPRCLRRDNGYNGYQRYGLRLFVHQYRRRSFYTRLTGLPHRCLWQKSVCMGCCQPSHLPRKCPDRAFRCAFLQYYINIEDIAVFKLWHEIKQLDNTCQNIMVFLHTVKSQIVDSHNNLTDEHDVFMDSWRVVLGFFMDNAKAIIQFGFCIQDHTTLHENSYGYVTFSFLEL